VYWLQLWLIFFWNLPKVKIKFGEGEKMKKRTLLFLVLTSMLLIGVNGYSMHIMEGFLPLNWVIVWFAVCIPFWIIGIKKLQAASKGSVKDKEQFRLSRRYLYATRQLPRLMFPFKKT